MAAADLTPNDKFGVGSVVGYKCQSERMDVLRGEPTRLCQPDGRWSGERPWCGKNSTWSSVLHFLFYVTYFWPVQNFLRCWLMEKIQSFQLIIQLIQ